MLAQAASPLLVEVLAVLALPNAGEGRNARGGVAVAGLEVGGQLRVGGEGVGVEAGSGGVEALLLPAELREGQALGSVGGPHLALQDCVEPVGGDGRRRLRF